MADIKVNNIIADAERLTAQVADEYEQNGNQFPVDAFPEQLQRVILATQKGLNFPVDYTGAAILAAFSVGIGNTHKIENKEGWQESSVMYLAIVGRPGTNKTHPLKFAFEPIRKQDNENFKQYERERQQYESELAKWKKDKDQNTDEPIRPRLKKMVVSDYTPEALAEVHKYNRRGIGVKVDELATWFKNFNRYNNGSEMEFWLSQWSGQQINIVRKTAEPTLIDQPFISVVGPIPTKILKELAKDSRTQNGFIDRFLFAMPDNQVKPYCTDSSIDKAISQEYSSILSRVLQLPVEFDEYDNLQPIVLMISPGAKALWSAWEKANTDQCNAEESDALRGIYSKLEMYSLRLALIIEIMRWACGYSDKHTISNEAMAGALKLTEYFKQSAVKAWAVISNHDPLRALTLDRQDLYHALPFKFTTGQGVEIAEGLGVPRRTFMDFLTQPGLFIHTQRGEYEKRL